MALPHELALGWRKPISRAEYELMVESGVFEHAHVELVHGVIVEMSPHGPNHDACIENLTELLVPRLAGRARVRIQSAFAASDGSQPEPDVAVVDRGEHSKAHPAKASLIIEVAVSSLDYDRTVKAQLYAECGVAEYWIVNVIDRLIEVHTSIVRGVYSKVVPYSPGEAIRPLSFPDLEIAVDDVLR